MLTAFVSNFLGKDLVDDKVYKDRLEKGLVKLRGETKVEIKKGAKLSVAIFIATIFSVVTYATLISKKVAIIVDPSLPRNAAIMVFMLACASLIVWACKVDTGKILNASTFKSGMSACICVLGVAWLGTTFVGAHIDEIKDFASTLLTQYPWMLAITLFFASMLLYSQGATTKALMPAALALGVDPVTAVASFAAVSALFVLPTYPTLIAAVEMDDTGSTRIGKYVFNHPFIIPGVIAITLSVIFGFMLGGVIL
jgi:anaerobic C4-dicarboxylate transporter DcuA